MWHDALLGILLKDPKAQYGSKPLMSLLHQLSLCLKSLWRVWEQGLIDWVLLTWPPACLPMD